MILENGLIYTGDAQLPTVRALAIAGDTIAGGVGVHETALASPEVVDLGGRCVLAGRVESGTCDTGSLDELRAYAVGLAARGVTTFRHQRGRLDLWQDLRARTLLPVRVRVLVDAETARMLAGAGVRDGFGDDLVRVVLGDGLDETRRLGTLLPGRLADLVVYDRDPTGDGEAEPVATMLGGRWTYGPPPW